MLHAFARNKSKAYKRYLGVRNSEPRISAEDEITSLVFGPLEFLSAYDNWHLWKLVLQSHASTNVSGPLPFDYFSSFTPNACFLDFWPRKDNIEPDLVVRFTDEQGATRSLLVELKWDAGVSGEDQLEKQWLQYQSGQHATSLHVFIAKRARTLLPDVQPWSSCDANGSETSRLRAISWQDFKHEIAKLSGFSSASAPLRLWSSLASGFLGQLEIRPFIGFRAAVRLAEAIPNVGGENVHFWSQD
jgi:hypothetical protein